MTDPRGEPIGAPRPRTKQPRTPTERILFDIWTDALGSEGIGIDDDFFELGGQSIQAIQILSRLRERHGIDVPLRLLFENSRLRHFSDAIDSQAPQVRVGLPSIRRGRRLGDHPVSFQQESMLNLLAGWGQGLSYRMMGAFRLMGAVDLRALRKAVSSAVARNPSLRATFSRDSASLQQHIARQPRHIFEVVDADGVDWSDAGLQHLAREELRRPFDLEAGPMLQVRVYKRSHLEQLLLLSTHHVVFDAWSAGLLNEQLSMLYEAHLHSHDLPLRRRGLEYTDYARWQRSAVRGDVLHEQLAHWEGVIRGYGRSVDFGGILPKDIGPPFLAGTMSFMIDRQLSGQLKATVRALRTTPYFVMRPLFDLALSGFTGQRDLIVATATANRPTPNLEAIVGFFANGRFTRTWIDSRASFIDVAKQVYRGWMEGDAYQDVPMEQALDLLRVPELVNVTFSVHDLPKRLDWPLRLGTARATPFVVGEQSSRRVLDVYLSRADSTWRGTVLYRLDTLTEAASAELVERFMANLRLVVQNPEVPVKQML